MHYHYISFLYPSCLLVLVASSWLHVKLSDKLSSFQTIFVLPHQVLALEDVFYLSAAKLKQLQGKCFEGDVLPLIEDVFVIF